ncbi:uncharacterized protein DS421_17g597920 [Arachis hypogaea]|nr:uncharacterized protein DS421_17g597920 [Arachis hypogaea]
MVGGAAANAGEKGCGGRLCCCESWSGGDTAFARELPPAVTCMAQSGSGEAAFWVTEGSGKERGGY